MSETTNFQRPSLAVVGLGPRGMILVERITAAMRLRPELEIDLLLFDPFAAGPGLHSVGLPDFLMLNTVAGQLSFYPHPSAVKGEAPHTGPALDQWCRERGFRWSARGEITQNSIGREVAAGDYLPRRLLGSYLKECSEKLLSEMPPNIHLRLIRDRVSDADWLSKDGHCEIKTSSGEQFLVDRLFLSLGHASLAAKKRGFQPQVPRSDETAALAGLGLTAMDMVAELTKGRGGIYAWDAGEPRYIKSGREPRIVLYSRSGRPFCARPDWTPEDDKHRVAPIFFTKPAIDTLRQKSPSGRLDFRRDVLPLIELDMRATYNITSARLREGPTAAAAITGAWVGLKDDDNVSEQVRVLEESAGPLDLSPYLDTSPIHKSDRDFENFYTLYLRADLRECVKGISNSPLKSALEVWRRQRDVIRYAVNADGLTEDSRAEFYRVFAPLSNRLVGGPQKERHAELLALLNADIVTLRPPTAILRDGAISHGHGSNIRPEHHRNAHIGPGSDHGYGSPLLQRLFHKGLLRGISGLSEGVTVDAHGHPISPDGRICSTVWLVGPAVEGASFYNHYVGTPDPSCPLFVDAQREIMDCLSGLFSLDSTSASSPRQSEQRIHLSL